MRSCPLSSRCCGRRPMSPPRSASSTRRRSRWSARGLRSRRPRRALLIAATGRSWPRRKSWPLLLLGGALLHGFGLAMTHAALVAVDATPTALVHAFHPILTAALGTVLLRERFASWQWLGVALGFVGVRARRAAVARHRQPGAAGAQPVRPHRRHAPAPAVLRRCAAVRIHRRPVDRRRADLDPADAAVRDAALALDRALSPRRSPGTRSPCRSSAWRSTT